VTPPDTSTESETPDPKGVTILLDAAEAILDDERERGRALDIKTAQFAAFSGTILTLDVTLGRGLLRANLGCVADIALPVLFLIGAGGLVIAAAFAVAGVLRPQPYLGIERDEVKSFARYPLLAADETTIRARLLTTISDRLLPRERARNDKKAKRSKYAAIALIVGLAGIAGQALTLGLDQLGA
jgi:hypothetical protein